MTSENTLHFRLREFTTTQRAFWKSDQPDGAALLQVREGRPAYDAIELSSSLDKSIQHFLLQSVETPMDSNAAFLCWFASEVSEALKAAAGLEV